MQCAVLLPLMSMKHFENQYLSNQEAKSTKTPSHKHTKPKYRVPQELHTIRVLYSARNLIKSIFSAQINKLLSPSG